MAQRSMKIGSEDSKAYFRINSHPEKTFPDVNTHQPDISMAGNPFKKGFREAHDSKIEVFPSGNLNFRMETN
jgi:hypothetical protein